MRWQHLLSPCGSTHVLNCKDGPIASSPSTAAHSCITSVFASDKNMHFLTFYLDFLKMVKDGKSSICQANMYWQNSPSLQIIEAKSQCTPWTVVIAGISLTVALPADVCSLGGVSVGDVVELVLVLFLPRPLPDTLCHIHTLAANTVSHTLHDNGRLHFLT